MKRGKLILVTGGARSGKSTFAEQYASESGRQVIYLATAEAKDEEMERRIEEHRRRRPSGFQLVEEPLFPERALAKGTAENIYLIDCLTMLLSNRLLQQLEEKGEPSRENQAEICDRILGYMESLAEKMQSCPADVLAVTNEVGSGIVPEHFSGRLFRDLAGKCNQLVAARADELWLTVCGIPRRFK